jgi:hypothetical protein
MAIDPQTCGHRFDFINGRCIRCKMSRKRFEDNGRPQCSGRPPDRSKRLKGSEDEPPGGAADRKLPPMKFKP